MPIVDRQAAEALIQEQLINTIQQDAPKKSVFMSLARKQRHKDRFFRSTGTLDTSRPVTRDGITSISPQRSWQLSSPSRSR